MSTQFDNALLPPATQTIIATVKDRLKQYVEVMAPAKPVSTADGTFQQTQLWRGVVNYLLQQETSVFVVGWGVFLQVVREHRDGCFNAAHLHRFREHLLLAKEDRLNFERLLHLAQVTADPGARVLAMKQIDLNRILAGLPSEQMRQKILEFYRL